MASILKVGTQKSLHIFPNAPNQLKLQKLHFMKRFVHDVNISEDTTGMCGLLHISLISLCRTLRRERFLMLLDTKKIYRKLSVNSIRPP